jgi:hypothetical protein
MISRFQSKEGSAVENDPLRAAKPGVYRVFETGCSRDPFATVERQ